jgi:hypothetical protein
VIVHPPKIRDSLIRILDGPVLRSRVLVLDRADVITYLSATLELTHLLGPICEQARQEFGDYSDLELFVYHGPEIADQHLTLLVRLPSYEADFITRLDRVTESFNDELCDAPGYLLLTSDFRAPRGSNGV